VLLAIDTSVGSSVAIVERGRGVVAERAVADTMRHAEVIGALIAGALDDAGITPAAAEAVAVGMGPGPFTGLRVGIAAARAFALGAGVRVLPLASHDAIALAHYAGGARDTGVLVVTDARRRELYWTAYAGAEQTGAPRRTDGPGLAKPDALPHPALARIEAHAVPAAALGSLGLLALDDASLLVPDQPLYLRSPDVTVSSGPKRVSR
jgi:tRNA threonylcarbamoyl adenosine modification protein YeaZ